MRRLTAVCVLWLGVCSGPPAAAQIVAPGPPGPYVIDVRGAISAIPQDPVFFPPVWTGTGLPSSGTGIEVGAHLYLIQLGPGRVGIGASALLVRGSVSPPKSVSGSTSASTVLPATPDVAAMLIDVAPQLSYNFGSADGWSYVSAGFGSAQVLTGTSAFGGGESGTTMTPAQAMESGTLSSMNVGGGARWFTKSRVAFSFDVRVHLVAAGMAEADIDAATPRMTLLVASAGISLR